MSKSWQNFTLKQQTAYPPLNNLLSSYGCISSLSFTNKRTECTNSRSRVMGSPKQKAKAKELHQQNYRLMAKIIEIKERKAKRKDFIPQIISKKTDNPEKQRGISIENKRLGRSLIMIKSGKTLERIKTQIAQQVLKLAEARPNLRMTTSQNLFLQNLFPRVLSGNNYTKQNSNKSIDIDSIQSRKRKETQL